MPTYHPDDGPTLPGAPTGPHSPLTFLAALIAAAVIGLIYWCNPGCLVALTHNATHQSTNSGGDSATSQAVDQTNPEAASPSLDH